MKVKKTTKKSVKTAKKTSKTVAKKTAKKSDKKMTSKSARDKAKTKKVIAKIKEKIEEHRKEEVASMVKSYDLAKFKNVDDSVARAAPPEIKFDDFTIYPRQFDYFIISCPEEPSTKQYKLIERHHFQIKRVLIESKTLKSIVGVLHDHGVEIGDESEFHIDFAAGSLDGKVKKGLKASKKWMTRFKCRFEFGTRDLFPYANTYIAYKANNLILTAKPYQIIEILGGSMITSLIAQYETEENMMMALDINGVKYEKLDSADKTIDMPAADVIWKLSFPELETF